MNYDPDALHQYDNPDDDDIYEGLPWNHCARYDGIPGAVWYANSRQVRGDQLQVGDWLDSLDHRGARCIYGLWVGNVDPDSLTDDMVHTDFDSTVRTVMFSFGDVETVACDVEYDVVDPDSQVTPDGTPVVTYDRPTV